MVDERGFEPSASSLRTVGKISQGKAPQSLNYFHGPLICKSGKPVFSLSFQCSSTVRSRIITHDACACNDDKVFFEKPLNWTTRSFIFAKQREYENGPATPEPSGETIVRGRDRGKRKEAELYAPDPSYRHELGVLRRSFVFCAATREKALRTL